ncbi:exodeoxyribonuclease III [Pseudomonas fluvialis]|jgi:exodeoxyribonuclease-3|uniref:Exodeoxyribonuclease III n=1 Tax=Pseudomonas fluvialis TaxID=1793966 RepID=A0A2I0CPK1_9PSED|nr:exodeoxyribonuclease III [Pseudomonas pharmacofabricae]PKF71088.1 exodeoxyribonuclease III [Pseudomonas pharmacofabricae]
MRIISVNVNGIQAAAERGLLSWLQAQNADVICLQDTRASLDEMDDQAFQLDGYYLYASAAEVPEQGGVALYSRLQPKAVISGLGFELADRYGRYLQADFDKVSIASLLLPSGQRGDEDLNQKFKFIDDFTHYLNKQRRKRREYIYCGSLYAAQNKLDVKNWRDCQQLPGFLAPERAWLDEVFGNLGYVDALREVSREGEQYSWWPDSEQAQTLNLGWRFDYQILTPGMRRSVRSARLPRQPRFSQHAPLIIDYDWTLSL